MFISIKNELIRPIFYDKIKIKKENTMVGNISGSGNVNPNKQVQDNQKTTPNKIKYHAGDVNISKSPEIFPSLHMTKAQQLKFWNILSRQVGQAINKNTQKMKKALQKLKESEKGE
jgi:hypothetical protein